MFLILLIAALVLLFVFRKQVWAWLQSPSDPLSTQLEAAVAEEKAVFGRRNVSPVASVGDPDVSKPKV